MIVVDVISYTSYLTIRMVKGNNRVSEVYQADEWSLRWYEEAKRAVELAGERVLCVERV